MRIVGCADDVFDLNIILGDFKDRMTGLEEADNLLKSASMAKYFLILIFTTWEKKLKRH